jgi:hypothetical protein
MSPFVRTLCREVKQGSLLPGFVQRKSSGKAQSFPWPSLLLDNMPSLVTRSLCEVQQLYVCQSVCAVFVWQKLLQHLFIFNFMWQCDAQ